MKKLILVLLLLFLSFCSFAQDVVVKIYGTKYGLYNARLEKWVLAPNFEDGSCIGNIRGRYYYQLRKNGLWGIVGEDAKVYCDFKWEELVGALLVDEFMIVKSGGSYGITDIAGHEVVTCSYKTIYKVGEGFALYYWRGGDVIIYLDELKSRRDSIIKSEKEARELKAKREAEQKARQKKEKELSSFTEYARNYVEPRINEWQVKGEFEKLADYQVRVTGPNRTAMIDRLTREAEELFIKENAALRPENSMMTLDVYDSENEAFHIRSAKLGEMVVGVPISDGRAFKEHFNSLVRQNAVFYIENDKIALASLEFYDSTTGKTFTFSNSNALAYNHYEIDPEKYSFDLVNVVTAKPVVQTAAAPSKRPSIKILSPEKNSRYSTAMVTVRYIAQVFDGSSPIVHVWINGAEADVKPQEKKGRKGASAAWDEVVLDLPRDREHPCNLMLSVTDGRGFSSENSVLSLIYAGNAPKPKLHIYAVGVSDYNSNSLSKLSFASKDATDFVKTIAASDLSLYDSMATPVVLKDKDATKANIEKSLSNLVRDSGQEDVVMLFFSGHGVQDGEDTYFMSVDADGDEPYSGVDFAFIRKILRKLTDKKCRVLIFMDTCHSGAMFGMKSAAPKITFMNNDIIGYYSSTAMQTSEESSDEQNGLFTKALIDGLKGNAKNSDGEITTDGLSSYIKSYVREKSGNRQEPIVENKQGDIVLYSVK